MKTGNVIICGPKYKTTVNDNSLIYSEYFLIENPSENEKLLANEILEKYKNKKQKKKLKIDDLKHLNIYANKIGGNFVFIKNISFDLYATINDNYIGELSFKNYFLENIYSLNFNYLYPKRKNIPIIYDEMGEINEQEIISLLIKEYDTLKNEITNEKKIFNAYEDFKLSSGIFFDIKKFIYDNKMEEHFANKNKWRYKDSYDFYLEFYIKNIQIYS